MKSSARSAVVLTSALLLAGALFFAGFEAVDYCWMHFALSSPKEATPADGLMVFIGGLLIGGGLGVAGFFVVLFKFWPRKVLN